jgi:hypothetical protein
VWTLRSVPLGKYWRSRPLVFLLLPRCRGACGSQKYTSIPVAKGALFPFAHLDALVPGQRAAQRLRQRCDLGGDGRDDVFGLIAVGEVHEHRVTGGAFHQRADRGLVVLAQQQVAFPVAGDGAVIGLLGAV